jgi:hypothetical protein
VAASVNEDRLAIDVFNHAEATGQPITLGMVERHLDELRSHDPACGCGLCAAAHSARAPGVYFVAKRWAGGIRRDQAPGSALGVNEIDEFFDTDGAATHTTSTPTRSR